MYLSSRDGVKARKPYRCALCGEKIAVSELHDTRKGVEPGDGFWTMRMHPECHNYEANGKRYNKYSGRHEPVVDRDWYEDACDPAFERADAVAFVAQKPNPMPVGAVAALVRGERAAPGGSKRAFAIKKGGVYTGRTVVFDDAGQRNKDWRQACVLMAHETDVSGPFRGPLRVDFDFTMPRLKAHYHTSKTNAGLLREGAPKWHTVKPDRTKLTRSTEDALKGIVWADDAQIVAGSTTKAYGDRPGCRITVTPL